MKKIVKFVSVYGILPILSVMLLQSMCYSSASFFAINFAKYDLTMIPFQFVMSHCLARQCVISVVNICRAVMLAGLMNRMILGFRLNFVFQRLVRFLKLNLKINENREEDDMVTFQLNQKYVKINYKG